MFQADLIIYLKEARAKRGEYCMTGSKFHIDLIAYLYKLKQKLSVNAEGLNLGLILT